LVGPCHDNGLLTPHLPLSSPHEAARPYHAVEGWGEQGLSRSGAAVLARTQVLSASSSSSFALPAPGKRCTGGSLPSSGQPVPDPSSLARPCHMALALVPARRIIQELGSLPPPPLPYTRMARRRPRGRHGSGCCSLCAMCPKAACFRLFSERANLMWRLGERRRRQRCGLLRLCGGVLQLEECMSVCALIQAGLEMGWGGTTSGCHACAATCVAVQHLETEGLNQSPA